MYLSVNLVSAFVFPPFTSKKKETLSQLEMMEECRKQTNFLSTGKCNDGKEAAYTLHSHIIHFYMYIVKTCRN